MGNQAPRRDEDLPAFAEPTLISSSNATSISASGGVTMVIVQRVKINNQFERNAGKSPPLGHYSAMIALLAFKHRFAHLSDEDRPNSLAAVLQPFAKHGL